MSMKPRTKIQRDETAPVKHELMDATNRFLKKGGPWDRLWQANRTLNNTIQHAMRDPETRVVRTRGWQPGMSDEEMVNRLVGHFGLSAEYANGPATTILSELQGDYLRSRRADRLDSIAYAVRRFEGSSQNAGFPFFEDAHAVGRESTRDAWARIGEDIGKWLDANRDIIDGPTQRTIAIALTQYREALAQVLAYVDVAKDKVARIPAMHAAPQGERTH